jgi:H/ACA ribonucleoprotein complex subunit 2
LLASEYCCAHLRFAFSLVVLAADITPIDIISHLPVVCEDAQIPYVFVPSKEELGHAGSTKRPTSCVFITPDQKKKPKGETIAEDAEYRELYDECFKEVGKLDSAIVL